ncbi:N-acetylneuraminate synthase [Anaerocolumna sedimenticola]|uniref:N-acetylneuraminate synthase n=1 Tax=Anaerocolumna sedimenticola TaxID=2696063 RepID=A0A6P1TK79_9FIRM|nr:N-acetylneuraminate synthase family protein [Anaerocolumna sedimenticola]QHQ60697.1 N-acetylneuraminate synthase [Anaerocolumna sedimenticola]
MKEIMIGKRIIKDYTEPYIIAEIGANHNGNIDLAKKMINVAKEKGADAVKFQSWTKDSIFARQVYDDNYFLTDDYRNRTDYSLEEIVAAYALGKNQQKLLKDYCDEIGITFSSTPFSEDEVDFLVDELDVDFIKIASMDLNNYPFLEYVAKKGKPIVLATGLSTLSEVDEAIRTILKTGNDKIILLHCVSIYPPKDEEVNINNIDMLRNLYGFPTGYSDHTIGITAPILSISKGACMIEKHFTLDKNMEGWDHKVSADPYELDIITRECKKAYKMLGCYNRTVNESEERLNAFRRSIVTTRAIKAGEVIERKDISFKRPGNGIEPKYLDFIVGKTAKRDIGFDVLIKMEDF